MATRKNTSDMQCGVRGRSMVGGGTMKELKHQHVHEVGNGGGGVWPTPPLVRKTSPTHVSGARRGCDSPRGDSPPDMFLERVTCMVLIL